MNPTDFIRHRVATMLLGILLPAAPGALAAAPSDSAPNSRSVHRNQTPIVQIGPLEFHGRNHGERVAIGRDVVLREGETNRDLVVVFGDTTIDGTVTGDLVSVLGNVTIGPTGRVRREMVVVGGHTEIHPDAEFHGFSGPIVEFPVWMTGGIRDWLIHGVLLGRPIAHQAAWMWYVAAAFLIFYLLIAGLLPRPVQACVTVLESKPATSFLAGTLALLLAGPLIALLAISLVGLIVLPFLLSAMAAGFLIGRVAVFRFAGQTLGGQTGLRFLQSPIPALVIGATLLGLLYAVPILGFLAWGLVGTLGTGAALIAGARSLRFEFPASNTPGIPDVKTTASATESRDAPAAAGAVPSDTEIALLPRMGFWIRLGATAMDLLVIGILVRMFGRAAGELFLRVWILYHLVMWAWKGTTVGGIVLRLNIVRLNGEPINFAVALVRCLSAFFSTLLFCLGFFWAGWSRDRQSWHDIIAGTVIVRRPPGTRLV
jgi:uncharacterized RDD family membrane protein YckC